MLTKPLGRYMLCDLESMLCMERNTIERYHERRFSTYKGKEGADVQLHRIDTAIPFIQDNIEDDDITHYDLDDAYYPIHCADIKRMKQWKSNFNSIRKEVKGTVQSHAAGTIASVGITNEDTPRRESPYHSISGEANGVKTQAPLGNATYTNLDIGDIGNPSLDYEQIRKRNANIASLIEAHLRERLNPQCTVNVFGSAINGLWTDASDLDLCVQIPNVVSRSATIRNLRRIAFLLEPLAPDRTFENIFTAKIPILHWKKTKSKSKIGMQQIDSLGCSIDISVNNVLAISNSALIGTYVACDERVKAVVMALKLWARARDLNDRSKGTLGSFALSLMVIHFLQTCNPPILVSLQDLALESNQVPKYVSGIDVRFTTDMDRIKQELARVTNGVENTMTVMQLIQEFFYYFGWTYIKNSHMPITIRSVDLQFMHKQGDMITTASAFDMEDKFMHVDNPFEVGVDVANISFHQRNRIVKEMRRAYKILKAGGKLGDALCD